jgi:3-oxoacyl-[acyl-carrier-protein] synthase-1
MLPLGGSPPRCRSPTGCRYARRSRNNRLALAALSQIKPAVDAAIERFGPDRIGIVIGTSTSGIAEASWRCGVCRDWGASGAVSLRPGRLGSPAAVRPRRWVTGPAYVHSSACASSAKALTATRLMLMVLAMRFLAGRRYLVRVYRRRIHGA